MSTSALDVVVAALVREAVRAELAPVVAELRALAHGPAPTPWLTVAQAAERVGSAERIIRAACMSGALSAARVGRRGWRVRTSDVDAWLAANVDTDRAQQPERLPRRRRIRAESPAVGAVCEQTCDPDSAGSNPMNAGRLA